MDYPDRKATHWGLTSIYSAVVPVDYAGEDEAEVWGETEVPLGASDERVRRWGNRSYPSMVRVSVSGDGELQMWPEQARALASVLLACADAVAATDAADTDPRCGHWAPCECRNVIGQGLSAQRK